ncbi:hypothetical protein VNO77_23099 [Canavalia gladiata]|uniref:Uncharacterized protein n=1 Tax=Canavalia gladiata TaxID=3824 RepID=A0AAN9L7A0_CANGL
MIKFCHIIMIDIDAIYSSGPIALSVAGTVALVTETKGLIVVVLVAAIIVLLGGVMGVRWVAMHCVVELDFLIKSCRSGVEDGSGYLPLDVKFGIPQNMNRNKDNIGLGDSLFSNIFTGGNKQMHKQREQHHAR